MTGWQWHQLDHMQIVCTSLQTDNHASTSSLNLYRPDALPGAHPTASKHWRHPVLPAYCQLTGTFSILIYQWMILSSDLFQITFSGDHRSFVQARSRSCQSTKQCIITEGNSWWHWPLLPYILVYKPTISWSLLTFKLWGRAYTRVYAVLNSPG